MTETSILNAYKKLILNAEHYIYIEVILETSLFTIFLLFQLSLKKKNQFFVTTSSPAEDTQIQNAIGAYLIERILQARK